MSWRRSIDGSEPVRAAPLEHVEEHHEERGARRLSLGPATLACPACDAPVALAGERVAPGDALDCPFCAHGAAVRDFLSFGTPTRPARVQVWARITVAPGAAARPR